MVDVIGIEYLTKLKEIVGDKQYLVDGVHGARLARFIRMMGVFKHFHLSVRRFVTEMASNDPDLWPWSFFMMFMPYNASRFAYQWNERIGAMTETSTYDFRRLETAYMAYHQWYNEEERLAFAVTSVLRRWSEPVPQLLEVCTIITKQDMSQVPGLFIKSTYQRPHAWVVPLAGLYAQNGERLCFYNVMWGDCRHGAHECRFVHRCLVCDNPYCPQTIRGCPVALAITQFFSDVLGFDLRKGDKFQYLKPRFTSPPLQLIKIIANFTLLNGQ